MKRRRKRSKEKEEKNKEKEEKNEEKKSTTTAWGDWLKGLGDLVSKKLLEELAKAIVAQVVTFVGKVWPLMLASLLSLCGWIHFQYKKLYEKCRDMDWDFVWKAKSAESDKKDIPPSGI